MKFYLAIAFALLMATAYGIRNKQDVGTTASGTTIVDPIAAVTPVATPVDDDTCTTDSDEYDNGNGICTWTNRYLYRWIRNHITLRQFIWRRMVRRIVY
jgi:hypothetical protein